MHFEGNTDCTFHRGGELHLQKRFTPRLDIHNNSTTCTDYRISVGAES